MLFNYRRRRARPALKYISHISEAKRLGQTRIEIIYLVSFNLTVVLSSYHAEVDAWCTTGKTDKRSEVP